MAIPAETSPSLRRLRALAGAGTNDSSIEIAAEVLRSSMMAINTTAIPATKPPPTSRMMRASITGLPNPGAPIKAAITTKDSAAITVWFIPKIIVREDMGS